MLSMLFLVVSLAAVWIWFLAGLKLDTPIQLPNQPLPRIAPKPYTEPKPRPWLGLVGQIAVYILCILFIGWVVSGPIPVVLVAR